MKCQMCGKSEVNFHYTSNINGTTTQTTLCSECAANSGYNFGSFFEIDSFFPIMSGRNMRSLMQMPSPGFNMPMQLTLRPVAKSHAQSGTCACSTGQQAQGSCGVQAPQLQVDEVMMKRRELHKQMREAAQSEDFERAAKLRDEIKELES
ncbi:MAG: UvrB/UvrC motif-containing protein [Oscillospiraceae bacterium]|nr:UvrB/UvrC motif-containing protein [Oscillospiraceae bacterium]